MSEKVSALAAAPRPAIGTEAIARSMIRLRVRESIQLKRRLLDDGLVNQLVRLVDEVCQSVRSGGKVILFGNGGSAADATHLAAEFVGRFAYDREPMPALSLSDNGSAVTAIGNDYDYSLTFARQLKALGSPGDVAIALSTSGASPNVLSAMDIAREGAMVAAAFTGACGTKLASVADIAVIVPSTSTARIQEGYMLYAHIMCELVEQELFGEARIVTMQ